MTTIRTHRILKIALLIDAAASLALIVPQLAFRQPLAELLALPPALLTGTAWFLILYAPFLAVLAMRKSLWQPLVWLVIIGNLGWSMASFGLLMSDQLAPSALGIAYVALQAVAVLGISALEYAGLKASQGALEAGGGMATSRA